MIKGPFGMIEHPLKLKHDPLNIFRKSKSPAGLYARQKWLGEEGDKQWEKDFSHTLRFLYSGQHRNGSWNNAVIPTVKSLFGLHLTIRKADDRVDKGLQWLLKVSTETPPLGKRGENPFKMTVKDLYALPFTPDRQDRFTRAVTLFLFTVFERAGDPLIQHLYLGVCREIEKTEGFFYSQSATHNIFRALAAHPHFTGSRAAKMITDRLAGFQKPAGDWSGCFSYYQTINTLAHLDFQSAKRQIKTAFRGLFKSQNIDGTWGKAQKEWNTFLTVHAMKRKAFL